MKRLKEMLKQLYLKSKVKKLCYISCKLGYKYTCDWIINTVPEAAYLISDYIKKHPGCQDEMNSDFFKNPDYILSKAEDKYKQVKMLEKYGFDTEDTAILK